MQKAGITRNTRVILERRGEITLRPSDHMATGGEGSIFKSSNTVIKLYTDQQKMQRDGMVEKIKLLSSIKHRFIVSPTGLVTTPSGKPLGYYMPYVNGEPMSRVFTTAFRNRTGFNDNDATLLINGMRVAIQFAHASGATLVDANEMNYLTVIKRKRNPEPRLIDVDSWAIGKWPASVIMPSIRDWHSSDFNELTDWFSWGIVTFQIYTGIHPYKGKLAGFKPGELEKRMKANASVFSKGVRLNRAVRNFSCIPGLLLDWYMATFHHGERTAPPSPFGTGIAKTQIAQVKRIVVTSTTGLLIFDKLFSGIGDGAIRIFPCGVVLLESGKLFSLSLNRQIGAAKSPDCEIIKTDNGWLKADFDGDYKFSFINGVSLQEEDLPLQLNGQKLLRYENRLFLVTNQGLTELVLQVFGKPVLSSGHTWGVMVNSTSWFDGVGIQNALGATYVIAPFGDNSCAQIRVKELDDLKPISAKAGNRFITVIGLAKDGSYHKVELTMSRDYKTYKAWKGSSDDPSLNIAILPKGVCVTIIDDGKIDIFVPASGTLNEVKDKQIATDMMLANWDDRVVYIHNGSVWSVQMK